MRCVECGAEPDEQAVGWRAYHAEDPEEDDEPELVLYCPTCALHEFGPPTARQ